MDAVSTLCELCRMNSIRGGFNLSTIGKATLQADEEGLVTLQCDRCKARFKMDCTYLSEELNGDIWCPSCGIPESLNTFWPEEVVAEAAKVAFMEAEILINQAFKGLNSKYNKVKTHPVHRVDTDLTFKNKDYDMGIVSVECCAKKVGLKPLEYASGYYCPYCGRMAK